MKISKYIIAFFLFLSAFLFIGESYTFFLENFQDKYTQVGYYLPTGESEEKMNGQIRKKAEEFNTAVFALDKEDGGAFSRTITVYGDETVKQYLKKDWNIENGTIKSFFSGTTTFYFEPFENATEKNMQNCWYLNKSPEELYDMVYPDMVEYSGAFRNAPTAVTSKFVVVGTWAVVSLCILLLTLYDVAYGTKEQSIRIILGAENRVLQFHKIFSDVIGLSISSVLAFGLLLPFTTPSFELPTTILCVFIMLIINSVLIWCSIKVKKTTPIKIPVSNRVLVMGARLKGLVAVLMVVVISVTIGLSVEGYKLYSQKRYYNSQKKQVHVDIDYPYSYEKIEYYEGEMSDNPPIDTVDQVTDNFLRYSYQHLDCSLLYHHSYDEVAPLYGEKYIYANLQGLEQYKDQILNWNELCKTEGNYILVSEKMNQEVVREELLSFSNTISLSEENLAGILTYQDGLSVVAEGRRDSEYDYSYCIKNPIIILDTYDYGNLSTYEVKYSLHKREKMDGVIFNNAPYLIQFVSVKDDRQSIESFASVCTGEVIKPELTEFSVENIREWFQGLWSLQNRSLLIAIILTVLLLILEFQITALILRISYETKAKELTIKKVLGYSIFERYRKFFILSGILCGFALIFSLVLFLITGIGMIQYMIYGSLIVWFVDLMVLVHLTHKYDHLEIQRVIKGGI